MKQKVITLLMVILIAGLMSLVVIGSNNKEKELALQKLETLKNGEPVLYYGETCPHCEDVEEWLDTNKASEKISFAQKEVWNNRQNAAELTKVAVSCGLDANNIGVPFLYAEEKCLIGSPEILAYFANKIGVDDPNKTAGQINILQEGTPSAVNN